MTGNPEDLLGPDARSQGNMVIDSDGKPIEKATPEESWEITSQVEQPAKVMRIGTMIKQLLEEVRNAPLDDAARVRLREIHTKSIKELEDGLSSELVDELERLSLPFADESSPSDAELRIAQAQLVGWLEGLFHGIQTALFAQQMAARAQYEETQRRSSGAPELPSGMLAEIQDQATRQASGPYL